MVSSSHMFCSLIVLCLVVFGQLSIKNSKVECASLDSEFYYDEGSSEELLAHKRERADSNFEPLLDAFIQYYKLYLNNQLNTLQKSIIKAHLNHLGGQLLAILKNNPQYELIFAQHVNKLDQNSAEGSKDKENLRNAFKWGRK
jgi:hypothetical protein